ncbi:MAG: hypothetical protein AAF791_05285 [Bacteroidota bacterium]
MLSRLALLAVLILALAACDDVVITDPCVENPASCQPPGPEIIGGVNVSVLLSPPSLSDLERARALWTEGAPSGYVANVAEETDGSDGARLYLLEVRDAGADSLVTFAIARRPGTIGLPPAVPVVLVAPADDVIGTDDFLTRAADEPLSSQWIQVVAVPRGGRVTFDGTTRQAPGPPSPYLFDAADAIGALTSAQNAVPGARGRAAAVGFGRGGTAALFASIREPSIRAVSSLAAPSDLFVGDLPDAIRAILGGRSPSSAIPAFGTIASDVLLPLQRGDITMEEARAGLFARSPAYFLDTIAPTVAFHGQEDGVVEVAHGRRLETALRGIPALAGSYVETTDSHRSLFENFGVRNEAATHLDQASR